MAGARAVLMPTLAEGFGLPAMEAQAAGARLIVSNRLGFEPQAGASTTILDPLDGLGWRDAIIAAASAELYENPASARSPYSTTQGWELHIGHVEQFIQSL